MVDRLGDEHLPADGLARHAGGVVHGGAEEVLRVPDRIAGVDADAHPDGRRVIREDATDLLLDGLGTRDGSASAREREHRPVALGLHDGPAVGSR